MKAHATFTAKDFKPTELSPVPAITTALPVSVMTMEKHYAGDIQGHSATLFTAAFDRTTGKGSYVAMESFEGSVNGKQGAFNFVHSASTTGSDRTNEFFSIVEASGTGELIGIAGTGGISIDADGTHRIWLEYQLKGAEA